MYFFRTLPRLNRLLNFNESCRLVFCCALKPELIIVAPQGARSQYNIYCVTCWFRLRSRCESQIYKSALKFKLPQLSELSEKNHENWFQGLPSLARCPIKTNSGRRATSEKVWAFYLYRFTKNKKLGYFLKKRRFSWKHWLPSYTVATHRNDCVLGLLHLISSNIRIEI